MHTCDEGQYEQLVSSSLSFFPVNNLLFGFPFVNALYVNVPSKSREQNEIKSCVIA